VPQSGDGDLWPTTDDDTSSRPAEGAATRQIPVPDQQEQRNGAGQDGGGWFDSPAGESADEGEKAPAGGSSPADADARQESPTSQPERSLFEPPTARTPRPDPPAEQSDRPQSDSKGDRSLFQPQEERSSSDSALFDPPTARTPQPDSATGSRTESDRSKPQQAGASSDQSRGDRPRSDQGDRPRSDQGERSGSDRQGDQSEQQSDRSRPEQSQARVDQAFASRAEPAGARSEPLRFAQPIPTKPAQQRTQPVSWPADLEKKAKSPEATAFIARPEPDPTTFSRPLPQPLRLRHDEATAFIARPTNRPDNRPDSRPDTSRPDNRQDEWPPPEPPRAAPQRVGPPPDEPEPEQQKRRRRPVLITLIALVAVVGIAAGVVFGVPGLSDKLGFTGEDAVAIDPPAAPVTFTPGLRGPDPGAPAPTPQGVEAALAGPLSDGALGTVSGVVLDPASGQTLYEQDGGAAKVPASTGKLLTAAAALLSLDHTHQLVTKVVEGEQPGEVVIVGGGDPTLSSLKPGLVSMYPGAAHLTDLVDQVKASGVQVQTVYIDQSLYAGDQLESSWLPADVANGYITPMVPAMLDGGRADATVNYSPRTTNPGGVLVDEFAARIGATAPESAEKKAPANAKVLGEVRSAPMAQLVDNMLDHSDNVLAEAVAREVAIKAGEEPSFDGASKATLDVLRQNNLTVDGVILRDASGMSDKDEVSAKLLADILALAAAPDGKDPRTAKLRPLLGGLPVAGGSGTLVDRYDDAGSTQGRGWLRAKTGSLTGVNTLAGVVLDKDNRMLVFAFLTSETTATTARPALDKVTAALRDCGCG
jgi:D-alanyl-D-alanine carboxypeptidase/D-alanyl-D-alanine-endopeptidase (penicillin-binding protein 4)